ncbi:hypothetical protein HK100_010842, partial [Physocladia obscura]
MYKDARKQSEETGFGVTEEDCENGIKTVNKLASMCQNFYCWDRLFGEWQNVNLSAVAESKLPETGSEDDDDADLEAANCNGDNNTQAQCKTSEDIVNN